MKTIRNSRSGEYRRVTNDIAIQLVSSGQWVYSSKFEARKVSPLPRPSARQHRGLVALRIAGALLAILIGAVLLGSQARAADKPVPFRVCLTLEQAVQTHKGKHIGTLKYRLIGKDKCWYVAHGATPAKAEFIPRSTSVAARPTRLITEIQTRVEAQAGAVPAAGANTAFTQQFVEDAFKALTGVSESSFDALWLARTGWAR